MNERPALCVDTPSRSAGGAACSACPTRSLSGDGHLPTPPFPPPTAPAPARGSEGARHQLPSPPGPPAAPRPGRSGSCRRTCPPGRGEARQTMGLRGKGSAREGGGMAELGATGWRGWSSGVTPGSPGFHRWTIGHPAARRAPGSTSTNPLGGGRSPAPRRAAGSRGNPSASRPGMTRRPDLEA